MGFISDLFDSEARKRNRIISLGKKMQQKFGQTEDRLGAAVELKKIGTDDAIRGLLKRFTSTCDNKLHDQDEKEEVSNMLVEMGPKTLPLIREYLRRESEITWVIRTLKRIVSKEEWTKEVLDLLGDRTSEDTDAEKICQILTVLHDEKDPRVASAVARCLSDLDDTVRFAAIETLATIDDDAAREPLLAALAAPAEESQRVTHRIAELFADRGWEVKGHRKAVEERLPEGFYLDRAGHIKTLKDGAPEA